MPEVEKITNTEINELYCNCIRDMALNRYRPDVVVGILRGGVDFSTKLSHYFKIPGFALHWQTRDGGTKEPNKLRDLLKTYNGSEILIVDDIVDSGKTIVDIEDIVRDSGTYAYVSYATAIYNQDTDIHIDYVGKTISRADEPQWFEFPWENWWS